MAEASQTPSTAAAASDAAQYRLVVRSAAEAVALVRERFGENARVISVRQIEAGGLARFLQKPRLEVIVEVAAPSARLLRESSNEAAAPLDDSEAPARDAAEENAASAKKEIPVSDRRAVAAPRGAGARREISLLRATGLDEALLERFRADHPGLEWDATPAPEAIARLAVWLRRQYAANTSRPLAPRRAFIGLCGAGKTTALCKLLSLDVFVRGRSAAVLKLDGDQPNATDGLAAFCEVLGAPLLRSPAEVEEFDDEAVVYVDVPGAALDGHAEHRRLAQTLDALRVASRVLVVNAAWENEVIAEAFAMGRACGATHVVFTHADEVRRPAKLWRFALFGGLSPLFVSAGPSPAGEIEEDVFGALLARTIPSNLARAAVAEGAGAS